MTLYSPEKGMEIAPDFEDEYDELKIRYIGKSLFPLFGIEVEFLCVIGDWEDKSTSPIVYVSETHDVVLQYVSLTNLLLTTADCLENKMVEVDEQGLLHCDEKRFSAIHQKHNSRLPEIAVDGLMQGLTLAGSNPNLLSKTWENFYFTVHWLITHWEQVSINQFPAEVIELLTSTMEREEENNLSYPRSILEELNYTS